jgi:hypothetical protein
MNSEDVLVLPTNPHLILLTKRMTDTWPLKAVSTIQAGVTESALGKGSLVTIPG